MKTLFSILGVLVIIGAIGAASREGRKAVRDDIYQDVASDTLEQYNIAKRGGDKMQICVHAGFVTAAYLQAKDEANYQKWLAIEKKDCKRAGL